MGFNDKEKLISLINGFKIARASNSLTVLPFEYVNSPVFIQAFPDTNKARFAVAGLAEILHTVQSDPSVNYTDFMRPDPVDTVDGRALTYGPTEHLFWADKSAFIAGGRGQGDRCLKFNLDGTDSIIGLRTITLPFRVSSGTAYRVTVRWAGNLADLGTLTLHARTVDESLAAVNTHFIAELNPVATDTLQYDSGVFTASSQAVFGYLTFTVGDDNTTGPAYVDEILVEPIGEYVFANGAADQDIETGAGEVVIFGTEVADYGSQYDATTGVFTCARPGSYSVTANITYRDLADQEQAYLSIRHDGTARAYSRIAHSGAGTSSPGLSCSTVLELERGDTVDAFTQHSSGVTRNLVNGAAFNNFSLKRID